MPDDRIQDNVPSSPLPQESQNESNPQQSHVYCPHCFRPTESLKDYNIGKIIFLYAGIIWDYDTVTACPSCMRKALCMRSLISIISANLIFPVVFLVYLCQIVATFSRGHSNLQIAGENRRTVENRFVGAEHAVRLWSWGDVLPRGSRGFGIVMAIIGMLTLFCLIWLGITYLRTQL